MKTTVNHKRNQRLGCSTDPSIPNFFQIRENVASKDLTKASKIHDRVIFNSEFLNVQIRKSSKYENAILSAGIYLFLFIFSKPIM